MPLGSTIQTQAVSLLCRLLAEKASAQLLFVISLLNESGIFIVNAYRNENSLK